MQDFTKLIASGNCPLAPQMTCFRFNLIPGALAALQRIDRIAQGNADTGGVKDGRT
jgi:hypothetical protein